MKGLIGAGKASFSHVRVFVDCCLIVLAILGGVLAPPEACFECALGLVTTIDTLDQLSPVLL